MLKQAMAGILTEAEAEELYGAFDQIGNIIILRVPDSTLPKRKIIGEVLLDKVKTAKSVYYQSSPVEGDYRIRKLELLAGDDKTETEYKEHGCRFIVDVEKTFFSPRLSTERERPTVAKAGAAQSSAPTWGAIRFASSVSVSRRKRA